MVEFEKDIIKERTTAGLKAARSRGRFGGRPKLLNEKQINLLRSLYQDQQTPVIEIAKMMNISKKSIYNYLK